MANTLSSGTARNVVGELQGSEFPDEVVLAGAHLDSWDISQGATDNGLGTAIVLEMGRALAALPRHPRRTMRFGVWAAEEVGLCGSRAHSVLHAADLENYIAVINFDMTAEPYGFWAPRIKQEAGCTDLTTGFDLLRDLCEQLAPIGMRKEFRHKAGLHSDHQPFMLEGVQAIALLAENRTQGAHFYHSVGDSFDKVSQPSMAKAAAVGAHTLWALADSAQRPFPKLSVRQVRKLIDEADLHEALVAEGYDGLIMRLTDQ
jgi:Zn-dependent M28 family amino/carboxypeptidase